MNDVLIKTYNDSGVDVPIFTEKQIAQAAIAKGEAVTPEITNGCSAISSGKIGYKPYAYFIGGVKKEPAISTTQNTESDISSVRLFDKLKLFFIKIFSELGF